MGYNGGGALGVIAENPLTPICLASNVVAVAAGTYYSLFVDSAGTLWTMGSGGDGELGDGTTADSSIPVSVASNVVAVAAGAVHSLFVDNTGTLWAMGDNQQGDLGVGTTTQSNSPVVVAGDVVSVAGGSATGLSGRWGTTPTASWGTGRTVTRVFP